MLNTGHPMYIWWGPELLCFYNDAYRQSIGPERHPGSLGKPGRVVWEEIWPIIGPQIDQVMSGGGPTWNENHLVPITRNGKLEDVYWTYSYGPIDDESAPNGVGGVLVVCTETTEQVRTGRRLAMERERQRLMLQQMPGFAALLAGPEHRYEYVNDAYREIAGDRDFIGRTVRDVFSELEGQGFYELLDRVYSTGESYAARAMPISLDRPDGERFIDFLYEAIRDDNGEITGIFVGGYDVTEQVRATVRLQQSEAELRVALEAGRLGAWTLNIASGELLTSPTSKAIFGRDPAAPFTYKDLREAVHDADKARMSAAVAHTLATGEDYDIECRITTPPGEMRWIHVRAQLNHDAQGEPQGLAGVSLDISARRAAEAELRDTAERLQLATENAEVGFWDVDLINDLLIWPPRTKAMFGISPEVAVTMADFYAGLHPDDRDATTQVFLAAADPQKRALYDVEYRTVGKEDGVVRWVAAKGRGVFDDNDNCLRVTGTAIDITARKQAEERLRELNETLEARVSDRTAELESAHEQLRQSQKLEAMGSLTGGVAHDFNNLLTPIVGVLDLLQRRQIGGEREQRLISGAAQSAERAKVLVQRLLAFARRQPLQPVAVDVGAIVRNMAELVSSTTGPQVKVVVEVDEDLKPAKADPNQLEMALLNLCVNARDAMKAGGTLRISVSSRMRETSLRGPKTGRYLCLSVADTGEGMDEETRHRAIEPFFSTKGIGKGTGLGLSMVHGLASQLGGALEISSTVGLGTNVELWLPETEASMPAEAALTPETEFSRGRGVVLLVEDEDTVRLSTADMLLELGYVVREAATAEEGLSIIRAGSAIDLVISDHLMPGMTGADLARAVQRLRPRMPVLIISGYADSDGIDPDLPRLTKPFRADELNASLLALASIDAG